VQNVHVKPEMLGALLCFGLFGLAIGSLLGAAFLRAACSLYNKLSGGAGSPDSVPEPDFGKAWVMTIVTKIAGLTVGFLLGFVLGPMLLEQFGRAKAPLAIQLLSLPASFLVMSTANAIMLPTTFSRGVQVTMFYMVVVFLAVFVLVFVVVVCAMLLGLALHGAH
jgi:hypothetical protein